MKVLEREILELAAQFAHAQSMRDGRVNVHRLLRDPAPLVQAEEFQRAHVVEPIGQLHEHDPHIVDHRQQHFAHILGLLLFTR